MTTKYFLYTKKDGYSVQDITGCQIINPASYAGTILMYPEESIDIHYNNAILEGSLIEWCKEFCSKDGIFLDIGAHTGSYSICLSDHCKEVYAFEPQKRTYYALCGSVVLSNRQNISCFQVGLGSPHQIITLGGRSPYQVVKSSINVQNEDGGNSSVTDGIDPEKIIRTEEIEMTTIDAFFKDRKLSAPIKFVKIDVENNELNVIQGAVKTLESNGYPKIVFEGHSDPEKQRHLIDYLENILKYKVMPISGYGHMFLAAH
jgi:FkbM family methyltransferase